MKLLNYLMLGLVALTLSSCTLNEANFNANVAVGRKHPELVAGAVANCERKVRYMGIEVKRYMAGYMHTEIKTLPETVCRRLSKGYLSGRLQWIDLKTLIERQMFTPTMTQVLRRG